MKNKLKIAVLIAAFMILDGCSNKKPVELQIEYNSTDNMTSMFIEVEHYRGWKVVYHKDTKVMYAVSSDYYNYGTFTLLVNPDGTPQLWNE